MSLTAVFSEWADQNLATASAAWADEVEVRIMMTPLVRTPRLDGFDESGLLLSQTTIQELLVSPGWQEATVPYANTVAGGHLVDAVYRDDLPGGTIGLGGTTPFLFASDAPVMVSGFALSTQIPSAPGDETLICVVFPPGPIYLTGLDDGVNEARFGAKADSDANYLFAFLETADDSGSVNPQIGDLELLIPTLDWEDARAAHAWLDPQRINYAVNPSMEASGEGVIPFGWRSNALMSKERGGIRPPNGMTPQSRQFCARLTGPESPKILESQFFPTRNGNRWWSIEAAISGVGQARIGIIFWNPLMREEETVYVCTGWFDLQSDFNYEDPEDEETEVIHQGEFRVLKALIPAPEYIHEGQFRLEFLGEGDVWVDNVLVEPNEAQHGYFDGEWEFGQVGDFTWYTGVGVQDVNDPHKTYSLFYNNRRALRAALLDPVDGTPPRAHVLSWVPEGASVVAHWDDVFSARLQSWIEDVYVPILDFTDYTVTTSVADTISLTED